MSFGPNTMRIGVDIMGGDCASNLLFEAIKKALLKCDTSVSFLVFLDKETLEKLKDEITSLKPRVDYMLTSDVISMQDDPIQAIRHKKHSSLVLGIRQLKRKKIQAFISVGNTGALLGAATLTLPKLPDIRRPALLASLPVENGKVAILDVGGTIQCKAAHFVRFALLGTVYKRVKEGIQKPRVGLLNVGGESKKGSVEHRLAYELLSQSEKFSDMQFLGNIEARDIFKGKVDVVVTDGFAGNVLLKTAEGMALFIFEQIKKKISFEQFPPQWKQIEKQFTYSEYPGAILLGVEGIIIKCHGDSSSGALLNGILQAISDVKENLIPKIKQEFAALSES